MIRLGTALKSKEPPHHRCLVISDPANNGGQVVLVRLTTDDGTWPDRDCVLTPADWSGLSHASTVAYSTCKFGPAMAALERAVMRGLFEVIPSPSRDVLHKVIAAAHLSAGMPPAAKKLLAQI
ncbi:MAG: hypothetical protein HS113_08565 [Verrucomicrobiales bacterium]|nr:hypothetical protein [Verrucomicrobiales bacterium]